MSRAGSVDILSTLDIASEPFAVLSETAIFQYKCDNFYAPQSDGGISIKDDSLGIDWRIPMDEALLSEKGTKHSYLADFDSSFDINVDLYPEFK